MRNLFTIDTHDYDPNGKACIRPSVRGIIIQGGKILMVHSIKYDYYKFPGGGIEPGETLEAALCREVAEESGMAVLPESVREYGLVHRIQKGEREDVFIQDNYSSIWMTTRLKNASPRNSSTRSRPSIPTASRTTDSRTRSC